MDIRILCLTALGSAALLHAPSRAATIFNLSPTLGSLTHLDLSSAANQDLTPGGIYGGLSDAYIFSEGTAVMPANSYTNLIGLAGLSTTPYLLHYDRNVGRGTVSGSFDLQLGIGESLFGWGTTSASLDRTDTLATATYPTDDIMVRGIEAATDSFDVLDLGGGLFRISYLFDNSVDTVDQARLFVTSAAAVPEPASWAMMIAGFGLVGGAMRYRRRAVMPA